MIKSGKWDKQAFSLEEPPVSRSALRDLEKVWWTRVVTWHSSFLDLLIESGLGGCFGRMSLACCQATKDGTLAPSSGGWGNSGMGGPTECWTLSSSESPRDAVVSSLSDILETGDVPQRYYLNKHHMEVLNLDRHKFDKSTRVVLANSVTYSVVRVVDIPLSWIRKGFEK